MPKLKSYQKVINFLISFLKSETKTMIQFNHGRGFSLIIAMQNLYRKKTLLLFTAAQNMLIFSLLAVWNFGIAFLWKYSLKRLNGTTANR